MSSCEIAIEPGHMFDLKGVGPIFDASYHDLMFKTIKHFQLLEHSLCLGSGG